MAERAFEMELDRLFAAPPAFADADLFVLQVAQKLDRGWTFRQVLIGGLGIVGGLIGGAQILGSGVLARVGAVTSQSDHLVSSGLADLATRHLLPAGLAFNAEALWMSAGLALLAIGFAVTRAIKQI
jgi:hypothetical protein